LHAAGERYVDGLGDRAVAGDRPDHPARLATAAENIVTHATGIDDILGELARVATTLRSRWTGEAQLAFDAAQAWFSASMTTRTEVVDQISDSLKALAEAYSDADLTSARALGVSA
jgi:WXG100 family type VII secretion target